jgi:glycosyltransferase involved in cell wall biosynthesis
VVATSVGGIPEIVRQKRTGFLVPLAPEQEVEKAAAEAALRLVEDPALRRKMGHDGRRVALAEFTARLSAERHVQLYEELLDD